MNKIAVKSVNQLATIKVMMLLIKTFTYFRTQLYYQTKRSNVAHICVALSSLLANSVSGFADKYSWGMTYDCLALCLSVECELQRQRQSAGRQFQRSTGRHSYEYQHKQPQQSVLVEFMCQVGSQSTIQSFIQSIFQLNHLYVNGSSKELT